MSRYIDKAVMGIGIIGGGLALIEMTVAAGINQFFDADEAPWSYLMSVAIVFSLPPIAMYYALRRYIVAGLTMGGVKA